MNGPTMESIYTGIYEPMGRFNIIWLIDPYTFVIY